MVPSGAGKAKSSWKNEECRDGVWSTRGRLAKAHNWHLTGKRRSLRGGLVVFVRQVLVRRRDSAPRGLHPAHLATAAAACICSHCNAFPGGDEIALMSGLANLPHVEPGHALGNELGRA
jgi:hypothetical protein